MKLLTNNNFTPPPPKENKNKTKTKPIIINGITHPLTSVIPEAHPKIWHLQACTGIFRIPFTSKVSLVERIKQSKKYKTGESNVRPAGLPWTLSWSSPIKIIHRSLIYLKFINKHVTVITDPLLRCYAFLLVRTRNWCAKSISVFIIKIVV